MKIQKFMVDHEQKNQSAVCKKIMVVNARDHIKENLFIEEENRYVNTDWVHLQWR